LSQSVVPIISAAYSTRDLDSVAAQASKTLRLSILTGLPAVLVICAAARPLDAFIFGNTTGSSVVAEHSAWIISALTASAMFQILMQTSGAILMGLGRMKPLIASVAVGIAVKLVFSYALASSFGIYGIIGATALCFIAMTLLNMRVLQRTVKFSVLGRRWIGLTVTTAAVLAAGWGIEQFNQSFMSLTGIEKVNDMLQAILACGIVAAVYVVMLLLTRTITASDIQHLPGPARKLAGRFLQKKSAASAD
jgi:stage V sporulation protein B